MARNKSEKQPHREVILAYAAVCEAWLRKPGSSYDEQISASWWAIPPGPRIDLSHRPLCNDGNLETRRRARLAHIRKTYGS